MEVDSRVTLLDALRKRIGLTGSKKRCDHGACGACTGLVAGRRVNACLTLAMAVDGEEIRTVQGLADALPLVGLAKELSWLVAVVDPRNRPASRDRFRLAEQVLIAPHPADLFALAARPRASAVVMTHNGADDLAMLRALLPSPVDYLGLLGPRRKADDLAEALAGEFDPVDLDRVRSPVGLDLGAESPAEIALATLAEIQAVLAGHPGGPLRDRDRPIHDRPDPMIALLGPVDPSRGTRSLGAS